MNPEVSVIIPAYNSEEYIAQALRSVLNQSYRNLEVILIDDASTDMTVTIARSFHDPRLKIISNQQNRGVSYSRNRGIEVAQGKWIALLDSDDWYAPQRLKSLLKVARAKNADLVADDLFLINDRQQQHWSTLLSEGTESDLPLVTAIDAVNFVKSDRLSAIDAKRTWSLGYTKPLIRKRFLLENSITYDEKVKVAEDFILYLECLRQGAKLYLLNQPYYYYRTRVSSLSTRKPTKYLLESCQITQSFINKEVCSQTESHLLEALLENLIVFQKRLEFYQLLEKIKKGKIWKAIHCLVVHPYLLGDLFKKLLVIVKIKPITVLKTFDNSSYKFKALNNKPVYNHKRELQAYTE